MNFEVKNTNIESVKIIKSKLFSDDRGWFTEIFNTNDFNKIGIPCDFKQMNHSVSYKNTVRGLHFQWDPPMGKLMRVTNGLGFLVAVDIRKGSTTYGQHVGEYFDEFSPKQMWAPAGFARGFCAISDIVEVQYLITGTYNPENESEIYWNDKDLNIKWPIDNPIVSDKDTKAQSFKEWTASALSNNFQYEF